MASLGGTVFDLMTSEISRLRAMSSLHQVTIVSARKSNTREIVLLQAAARRLCDLLI